MLALEDEDLKPLWVSYRQRLSEFPCYSLVDLRAIDSESFRELRSIAPTCTIGDLASLHERILAMAVGAHAVLIQIYLRNVHSENENGDETEV